MWRRTHHTRTPALARLAPFQEDKQVDTLQDQHALLQCSDLVNFISLHTLMKKLACRTIMLTKFQQCNVVRMVWEVLVDNHFDNPDMFPVGNDEKQKKQKGVKWNSTFVLPDLCYGHEVPGWRRWLLRARALQCNFPWLTVMIDFHPS